MASGGRQRAGRRVGDASGDGPGHRRLAGSPGGPRRRGPLPASSVAPRPGSRFADHRSTSSAPRPARGDGRTGRRPRDAVMTTLWTGPHRLVRATSGVGGKALDPRRRSVGGRSSGEQVSSLSPVAGRCGRLPGRRAVAGALLPSISERTISTRGRRLAVAVRLLVGARSVTSPSHSARCSGVPSEAFSAVPRTGKTQGRTARIGLSRAK